MTATELETVHIIVGWDDDHEQPYTNVASPGDADNTSGIYEADVPAALWREAEAKYKEWRALDEQIVELAGFDTETARMAVCCPVWRGDVMPGHNWVQLCVPPSGDENVWPAGRRPVDVAHCDTRELAERWLMELPEHFQILVSSHLVPIDRSTLIIEERGYQGRTSSCYECGWERDEHADQGTAE